MKKTLLRNVNFLAGMVPKGTELELLLKPDRILASYNGRTLRFAYSAAKLNFGKPFTQMPNLARIEKMVDAGIATTPTGKRVETDGYGEDGSPSWLIVCGLI